MARKYRKRAGRRLAERQAVRQRLRIQQAEFDDTIAWGRSPKAPARPKRPALTPLERELAPFKGFAGLTERQFKVLVRLAGAVKGSKLVDPAVRVSPNLPIGPANTYLGGLAQLAKRHRTWMRQPEAWKRRSHNRDRQFASLARHLLVEYGVPLFMDEAWFSGNRDHQTWFIRIGRGRNIRRESGIPIPMTKRMAHEFMNAPADLGVNRAIRWSQAISLGATTRTARAFLGTRIGQLFEHDEFWVTVVRFFIRHSMLDPAHYGPIVDYLHNERFVAGADGEPRQPNLSMRDRTPGALLRDVERWHTELAGVRGRVPLSFIWGACGVSGYYLAEGAKRDRIWTIRELRSSEALFEEGRAMGHCVASYAESCQRGHVAIFSMTFSHESSVERRLTIAVNPATRSIEETAGKHNRRPRDADVRVLEAWAAHSKLTLSNWVCM